jgi:hypothetical protein
MQWPCPRWVEVMKSWSSRWAADPHRDRLLTGVQVHEPGDPAVGEQLRHPFLERSDGHHAVVEPEGLVLGQLHGVLPVDLDNPGTQEKPTLASRPSHGFVSLARISR